MQKTTKKVFVIAVDGQPAAGKGTLAKSIASHYNMLYIDTGAMFRAFGLYFVINKIKITDDNIKDNIDKIDIDLISKNSKIEVFLNKEDVTDKIRTSEVTYAAKTVSKNKLVREKLIKIQRKIALTQNCVLDGQDIGTVVFPNADVKLFLVASLEKRALRRKLDFDKKGEIVSFEQVKEDIEKRTLEDSQRKIAPLKKANDAFLIDNSDLTIQETIKAAIDIIEKRIEI